MKLISKQILFGLLVIVTGIFIYLQLGTPKKAIGATETLPAGSFIINMGITPQTYGNGLKPYGLVYEMICTYNIPVKWVINTSKVKDGNDFTFNSVNYAGGTFIIPGNLINATIQSRITYWISQGVQGVYTNSAISVPVYTTLNSFPRVVIDTLSGNESIIINYFNNAGIPSAAYRKGTPASVTACDDLWINPHGDPTWSSHGNLYNFVMNNKGYIWSQCHSVSMMENVSNPSNSAQKMNFLSSTGLQCYGSSKCGSVSEVHVKNPVSPFTTYLPGDPVMQFMGTMSGSCLNGSEQWYIPLSAGGWRGTTNRLVITSTGASPREGILMAYGPAFGNINYGYVMYEAGHDLDGAGSTAEKVAAQRAFLNFCLLAGRARAPQLVSSSIQTSYVAGMTGSASIIVSGGTAPYTYQWSSSISGTFSAGSAASTTFTPVLNGSNQTGSLTVVITDACNRVSFQTVAITVSGSALPVNLLWTKASLSNPGVLLTWATGSERGNDYFMVYRSTDNQDYLPIGKVKGAGNSYQTIQYEFHDKGAPAGSHLYRLSQTDFDGTSTTFEPVAINTSLSIKSMSVFPNPVSSNSKLSFESAESGNALIEFWNSLGQKIYEYSVVIHAGENQLEITGIDELKSGNYILVLRLEDKKFYTSQFVKR